MARYVTDTHALIWHLQASGKLSRRAQTLFREADVGRATIFIPSIVLVELVYLSEKGRIEAALLDRILGLLVPGVENFVVVPLEARTVHMLREVARSQVPEMPDRIIAATAKQLGLPLITRDPKIAAGVVQVIW
jgi:PIN domain nuclease of toxin-antitoxin system